MRNILFILFFFVLKTVHGNDGYPRNEAIDIRHYQFTLFLNDSTDRINGQALIVIRFKKEVNSFELDLAGINSGGRGMIVAEISSSGTPLQFAHKNDRLSILMKAPSNVGDEKQFTIIYSGIPQDGLIIGRNKFGDRTFFGDNWPDRAHQWLPTIDHPYDKATCEFIVTAPEQYAVIATGEKVEESSLGNRLKTTHWKTAIPLPTKVMVIGVARFAIEFEGNVSGVPLQSWVYPQNKKEGFSQYSLAAGSLDYYIKTIGLYPYEKLANVQSTTHFGGMENAGNIFYYENSVTAKGIESLLAHEVAHQWFGDSATESDWHHIWLSEGLATYLANLYLENKYGRRRLTEEMQADRLKVINFSKTNKEPIVDPSIKDIKKLLNTNAYQKASWVLHMLRHEIDEQKFGEGLREYYRRYRLSNADTEDFRKVMEEVSGKDLQPFFNQWIFSAGQPEIAVTWHFDGARKLLYLATEQKQKNLFDFNLDVGLVVGTVSRTEKIHISARKHEFTFPMAESPSSIILDPEVWLLFTGTVKQSGK